MASNNEGYKFLNKLWRCKGGEVKREILVSNEVIKVKNYHRRKIAMGMIT